MWCLKIADRGFQTILSSVAVDTVVNNHVENVFEDGKCSYDTLVAKHTCNM